MRYLGGGIGHLGTHWQYGNADPSLGHQVYEDIPPSNHDSDDCFNVQDYDDSDASESDHESVSYASDFTLTSDSDELEDNSGADNDSDQVALVSESEGRILMKYVHTNQS